jgi:GntR family histidine utilization transcriptional repressor
MVLISLKDILIWNVRSRRILINALYFSPADALSVHINAARSLSAQSTTERQMTLPDTSSLPPQSYPAPKPLYEQVKSYVLQKIRAGDWPTHSQIPSEHALVRNMNISRMTIHRALRELTKDGYLDRIQGVGTFVAESPSRNATMVLKEIDEVIREKGMQHQCDIHFLQGEPVSAEFAVRLGLREGDEIYRLYCVHRENGSPVMLEDRYVNPTLAPGFLTQDFTAQTAESYFRRTISMLSHDHQLAAAMSTPEAHHFLELEQPTSCLQINRRTWAGTKVVSFARLLHPGHRYQIRW